jgi:hypothetical protein
VAELAISEVVPLAIYPIVEVISLRRTGFQQLAAKELVNQQCGNVALARRRPTTGLSGYGSEVSPAPATSSISLPLFKT